MFRRLALPHHLAAGFPHSRGDVPGKHLHAAQEIKFSPLTWGCSVDVNGLQRTGDVFPTHVGMFRSARPLRSRRDCFPHSRGDVPYHLRGCLHDPSFSPLTWGCSEEIRREAEFELVFPTHVGMFREADNVIAIAYSFPHSRGDVPLGRAMIGRAGKFSPLTWGCSDKLGALHPRHEVFPTHVGMFRPPSPRCFRDGRFPHSRGDVPTREGFQTPLKRFSPLTWGCSGAVARWGDGRHVFPTHVGMFRGVFL